MNSSVCRLKEKLYGNHEHPYCIYEKIITKYIQQNSTVLDVGCGREAPVLRKFNNFCDILIGIDIADFNKKRNGTVHLIAGDIDNIGLRDNSIDIVISRSVFEHIESPMLVYQEIHRVLKPGGCLIFLTPNLYDYASLFAQIIPNCFHAHIVKITEGRDEQDTFPTYYRSNTQRAIEKLAASVGFRVSSILYLGQYPSYFVFNPLLFLLGTAYDKIVCRFESLRFLRGWILAVLHKK